MILGKLFMDAGDFGLAESEFRAALKENPRDIDAMSYMGTLSVRKKIYRDALLAFSKVLQIEPNAAYAKEQMGAVYQGLGNREMAIKNLMESAAQYTLEGKKENAAGAYKKILEIDPAHEEARKALE